MKLIRNFRDLPDAVAYSDELRAQGILTHISSEKSQQMSAFTGVSEVGVWVVLPEQYDIENPKVKLSPDEIEALESQGSHAAFDVWNKVLVVGGLFCTIFILYVFISA